MGDTIVILPTYNEKENIIDVMEGVLAQGDGIDALVVDDSSPDGTAEAVRDKYAGNGRVHLLDRKKQRGRGYAGAAGFRWAVARPDYKYIIEMDADGSHNPVYIPALIEALGKSDLVVCSRLVRGGGEKGRPYSRRMVTTAANMYIRLALGFSVRDCTSGYRGYRREVLAAIPWEKVVAPGPSILQEVMFLAKKGKFSMSEIPFIFEERHEGESKLNPKLLVAGLTEAVKIRLRHSGQ